MDLESFKKIYLHWKDRTSELSEEERKQLESVVAEFQDSHHAGIMLNNNDEIKLTNNVFNYELHMDDGE